MGRDVPFQISEMMWHVPPGATSSITRRWGEENKDLEQTKQLVEEREIDEDTFVVDKFFAQHPRIKRTGYSHCIYHEVFSGKSKNRSNHHRKELRKKINSLYTKGGIRKFNTKTPVYVNRSFVKKIKPVFFNSTKNVKLDSPSTRTTSN